MTNNKRKQRDKIRRELIERRGGTKAQDIRRVISALDQYAEQIDKRMEERNNQPQSDGEN